MDCIYAHLENNVRFNSHEVDDLTREKTITINREHLLYAIDNNNLSAVEYIHRKNVLFDEEIINILILNEKIDILSYIQKEIRYIDLNNLDYLRLSINENKLESFNFLIQLHVQSILSSDIILYIIETNKFDIFKILYNEYLNNKFNLNHYKFSIDNRKELIYEYIENQLFNESKLEELEHCIKYRIENGIKDFSNEKIKNYVNKKWIGEEKEMDSTYSSDENEIENISIEDDEEDAKFLQHMMEMSFVDSQLSNESTDEDENVSIEDDENDAIQLQLIMDNTFLENQLKNELNEDNDENVSIEDDEEMDSKFIQYLEDMSYVVQQIKLLNINNEEEEDYEIVDSENDALVLDMICNHSSLVHA